MPITRFQGQFRFLSNFVGGVEQKYQAAKCLSKEDANRILTLTPGQAKRAGRKVKLRPDWDNVKVHIMTNLIRKKFYKEPFRSQLIATGSQEIIEGNDWGDHFWGVCMGFGENQLGKILMRIRNEIKEEEKFK